MDTRSDKVIEAVMIIFFTATVVGIIVWTVLRILSQIT